MTRPRPIFPGAAQVAACRLICEGSGVSGLYLYTLTADSRAHVYRVPDGVRVHFLPGEEKKGGAPVRAVFSSPTSSQVLDLRAAHLRADLLEGLADMGEAAKPGADLPGRGHTLQACAVIFEEDRRPALYFATDGPDGVGQVFRLPEGVGVTLEAPDPLPEETDKRGRATALKGRAVFSSPDLCALAVSSVRSARLLLEALEDLRRARHGFEGHQGAA